MLPARAVFLVGAATATLASGSARAGKRYTLTELLQIARTRNPGLAADAAATDAMEAQLLEAHRAWLPTGDVQSLLAAVPGIQCQPSPGVVAPPGVDPESKDFRQAHCDSTNIRDVSVNLRGVFTRTELKLVQPLFTFGKISAGVAAAEAGLRISEQHEAVQRAELDANVRRAYYGMKLARDVMDTFDEGIGYLDEAQEKIETDLAKGQGTASVTDKLRLRTVRAEAEARRLEARRLGDLARSGLHVLLGPGAPADLDVDEEPLDALEPEPRPLSSYQDEALVSRAEVRLLDMAVNAKKALADLERSKQYPDLVLVGTATYAYASSTDDPQNAFFDDPFNTRSVGLAAALRMPLDLGPKNARVHRARAEASEMELRRREALGGIALEIDKAYGELTEATLRVDTFLKGEKAGKAWITAVAQNFELGLAETRDFADALAAFFQMRIRYLQALYDQNVAAAALARATGAEVPVRRPAD